MVGPEEFFFLGEKYVRVRLMAAVSTRVRQCLSGRYSGWSTAPEPGQCGPGPARMALPALVTP